MEFDSFWNYDQPAETEQRFRDLLLKAEKDSTTYIELLTQIARAQGLQKQFEAAHQTLDEAQKQLNATTKRPTIRYLLERGRVWNSSGQPDKAKPLFIEAWEAAKNAREDHFAVDAAHMVAIVEQGDAALDWNRAALDYAEASTNAQARQWLGSLYNNVGWTYHDMTQYDTALDYFYKAQAFREQQGNIDNIRIAQWCVARNLRSLQRFEEALAIQQALYAEHEAAGTTDGYVLEELGECLLALGKTAEAQPFLDKARKALSTIKS